jgi:hypothetical protein
VIRSDTQNVPLHLELFLVDTLLALQLLELLCVQVLVIEVESQRKLLDEVSDMMQESWCSTQLEGQKETMLQRIATNLVDCQHQIVIVGQSYQCNCLAVSESKHAVDPKTVLFLSSQVPSMMNDWPPFAAQPIQKSILAGHVCGTDLRQGLWVLDLPSELDLALAEENGNILPQSLLDLGLELSLGQTKAHT